MSQTLYDKIWSSHLVKTIDDHDTSLIYVDRHLIHEVTSPQAFEGLRINNRKVRRPECTLAVADHNVPTSDRKSGIKDELSRIQVEILEKNCKEFNVPYLPLDDIRQGIVHVVGPEQGFIQPGMITVCGDSHTSTHGALGALSFGIGTSEVEHVMATQTLVMKKSKNMLISITGSLPKSVTAKDIILKIIQTIGTAGGTGYVIEYKGEAISELSIEGRMTICNMSIEAGARAGLIASDEKTFDYLKDKNLIPKGEEFSKAKQHWKKFYSDNDAKYDKVIEIDISQLSPLVTWGTSPEDVVEVTGKIPMISQERNKEIKYSKQKSLEYMGLKEGTRIQDIKIDKVFIGSCTNSRIEDLRQAAAIVKGKKVNDSVYAMVVAGSGLVKQQAEKENIHKIFLEAGFDWREPGCSMCLAMNADKLKAGERCVSTSNRNFEGRQGRGGRTHLASPEMAAAATIYGKFVDIRDIM